MSFVNPRICKGCDPLSLGFESLALHVSAFKKINGKSRVKDMSRIYSAKIGIKFQFGIH